MSVYINMRVHTTHKHILIFKLYLFLQFLFLGFLCIDGEIHKTKLIGLNTNSFFSLRQLQVDALSHPAHQLFLTVISLCPSFQLTHQPLSFYRSNLTYYFPKNIKTIQPGLSCLSLCFLQLSLYFHPCFSFLPMLEG